MSRKTLWGPWILCILLAGCAEQPPLPPAPTMPAAWEHKTGAGTGDWPSQEWYREFGSDELNTLIQAAVAKNPDLAAAQARVLQADAHARAAGAAILPQLDAGVHIDQINGRSASTTAHETDIAVLLSASYEVDFWGRNRALESSARLVAGASRADRSIIELTTLAGVADTYFSILALREHLALAQADLDASRGMLTAIEARAGAGAANPLEVAQQRAAVANTELLIPELTQQETAARGALALLLGATPEGFNVSGTGLDALREPTLAPGLPAELLTRRPDLQAAEARLASAHADVAAARAALLPAITLTSSTGFQDPGFQAALLTLPGAGLSFAIGASLVQSIFDHGRRVALSAEAEAREQELLENYRATVLAALLDVENALATLQQLDLQQAAQAETLAQSEQALGGAQARYQQGAADYLTLLEARRTLNAAQQQMSRYRLARLRTWVGLGKALGGGWQSKLMTSGAERQ